METHGKLRDMGRRCIEKSRLANLNGGHQMKMFKLLPFAAILAIVLSIAVAYAAEEVVTGEITDVVTAVDKNGNDYTRLIVSMDRTLEGTQYTVGLPIMAFGEHAEPAAALSAGQTLKAICQTRIFQGAESYTIVKILE